MWGTFVPYTKEKPEADTMPPAMVVVVKVYLRLPKPKLGRSTLRKAEKRGLLEAASLP